MNKEGPAYPPLAGGMNKKDPDIPRWRGNEQEGPGYPALAGGNEQEGPGYPPLAGWREAPGVDNQQ